MTDLTLTAWIYALTLLTVVMLFHTYMCIKKKKKKNFDAMSNTRARDGDITFRRQDALAIQKPREMQKLYISRNDSTSQQPSDDS